MLKFIDGRVTDILVVVDMAVVVVYVANVNIVEAQLLRELLLEYSGKIPECAIVDGFLTVLMRFFKKILKFELIHIHSENLSLIV